MTDKPLSARLRDQARAFRFYGASAEATELEQYAKQFERLENEIAELRKELKEKIR